MALADIPTAGQRRRLDSWKEIAEYLGRDVRTATRWEAQGLPLHRIPGGKGRSVFAFSDEIDAWMAGREAGAHAGVPPDAAPAAPPSRPRPRAAAVILAAAIGLITFGTGITIRNLGARPDSGPLHATVSPTGVAVAHPSGRSRVLHRFGSGAIPMEPVPVKIADVDADGSSEVLIAIAAYDDKASKSIAHGELLNVSPAGELLWRFGFDDVVGFDSGPVSGPWAIIDWQIAPGASPARIAVAAHDYVWWAAMAAVIDHEGRRLGTFVNPGWIESLMWLGTDRLAVAGFNNARDEGMVAVLDADRIGGQAPGSAGTPFACLTCPPDAPLFYATFPRSELNRVTAGRFNRARVSMLADRIVLTTAETGPERSEVNAIYEFDAGMRLLRARYSDRYWDEHRRLEREGVIAHPRATCPDRDGPAAVHVWAGSGWSRVAAPR